MRAAMFALWALFRLQRIKPSIMDVPALPLVFCGFERFAVLSSRPVTAAAGRGPPAFM